MYMYLFLVYRCHIQLQIAFMFEPLENLEVCPTYQYARQTQWRIQNLVEGGAWIVINKGEAPSGVGQGRDFVKKKQVFIFYIYFSKRGAPLWIRHCIYITQYVLQSVNMTTCRTRLRKVFLNNLTAQLCAVFCVFVPNLSR